ncbi:MAG: DUF1996 domain-containing protein [Nocardioidaceae bacterium]
MKRTTLTTAATVVLLAGMTAVPALATSRINTEQAARPFDGSDPSTGAWSSHCDYSGQTDFTDPIKARGGSSMHAHVFFGPSTNITPIEKPKDLRAAAANICNSATYTLPGRPPTQVPVQDNSAYWVPELLNTNVVKPTQPHGYKEIKPAYALVYYRNELVDPTTIEAFPQNLSIVGGNSAATGHQGTTIIQWSCVAGQNYTTPQDTIPASCDDQRVNGVNVSPFYLRMVVQFPNCIIPQTTEDPPGLNEPTAQTYSSGPTGSWQTCPPGYTPIPTIQVGARWDLTKTDIIPTGATYDLSGLYLSSDLMIPSAQRVAGETAHADFMSGFTTTDIQNLVQYCVNAQVNCGYVAGGGV